MLRLQPWPLLCLDPSDHCWWVRLRPGWKQCVGQTQLKWRAGWCGGLLLEGRFGAGLIGWASPPSRGPGGEFMGMGAGGRDMLG